MTAPATSRVENGRLTPTLLTLTNLSVLLTALYDAKAALEAKDGRY